jgi:hypothetical protein
VKRRTWAIQEVTPVDNRVLKRLGFHVGDEDSVTAHLDAVAGEPLGVIRTTTISNEDRVRVRLTQISRKGEQRAWIAVELLTHYHI